MARPHVVGELPPPSSWSSFRRVSFAVAAARARSLATQTWYDRIHPQCLPEASPVPRLLPLRMVAPDDGDDRGDEDANPISTDETRHAGAWARRSPSQVTCHKSGYRVFFFFFFLFPGHSRGPRALPGTQRKGVGVTGLQIVAPATGQTQRRPWSWLFLAPVPARRERGPAKGARCAAARPLLSRPSPFREEGDGASPPSKCAVEETAGASRVLFDLFDRGCACSRRLGRRPAVSSVVCRLCSVGS